MFDLYKTKEEDLTFSTNFTLLVKRNDYIHALITYFTVDFTRCHTPTGFSTGPEEPITHWKQTIFYLDSFITAKINEIFTGKFSLQQNPRVKRDLNIDIKIDYEGEYTKLHEFNHYRLR